MRVIADVLSVDKKKRRERDSDLSNFASKKPFFD